LGHRLAQRRQGEHAFPSVRYAIGVGTRASKRVAPTRVGIPKHRHGDAPPGHNALGRTFDPLDDSQGITNSVSSAQPDNQVRQCFFIAGGTETDGDFGSLVVATGIYESSCHFVCHSVPTWVVRKGIHNLYSEPTLTGARQFKCQRAQSLWFPRGK
jgi:hypothetical protein